MNEIEINRHNHLVDPALEIWGPEVAVYLFLGGIVAGVMIFTALFLKSKAKEDLSRWVRYLPWAAPVLISIGMGALFLDLEHKLYVYRFYLAFNPASPMSWGAWILLLIYPATMLLGLAGLTDSETEWLKQWAPIRVTRLGGIMSWARDWGLARLNALCWTNVGAGVMLGVYTGILLGTLEARAMWNSTMLGLLFLVSGLSTGAAFMLLFPLKSKEHHILARWDIVIIGAEVVLLGLFILDRLTACAVAREQVMRLFGGDVTAAFWGVVVIAGLAVPVALELLELRGKHFPTRAAPILILLGGFGLRCVLVCSGQAIT